MQQVLHMVSEAATWISRCLLLMIMASWLWAHPHISRAEAETLLAEARTERALIEERHQGPPPATHADARDYALIVLREAECLFLLGDLAGSLALCDAVVARQPQLADAYSMRRAAYQALGRYEEADADAQRYLQLGAGDPSLAYALARRPVPDDDPQQALATRQLQLQLVESARQRWPDDDSLLAEQVRLLSILDEQRLTPLLTEVISRGPDSLRYAAAAALYEHQGAQRFNELVSAIDHRWLAAPPAAGASSQRIDLAVLYGSAGLRQWAQQAAAGALLTLALEEDAVPEGIPLSAFMLQGIRGERARALAVLDRWAEALDLVDQLLADYHDPLTWLAARVAILRELGDAAAAEEAEEQFRAYFKEVGLEPPEVLPSWP